MKFIGPTSGCCIVILSLALFGSGAGAAITDGLVGHYKLDGNADDSSPSENHAVPVGEPGYIPGRIGQAISLDGTSQRADALDPPGLAGLGPKSISAWFNQAAGAQKSVISFGGFDQGILFELLAYNGVVAGHFYGDDFDTIAGAPAYTFGQWHHAVVTYDGTTVRVYLDGRFGNEKELALDTVDSDVLNIGSGYLPFFNGAIDDVGLWDRELSAAEVQAIYVAGLSGMDLTQAEVAPITAFIQSPVDGALFAPGTNITIEAGITAAAGNAVTLVEFFADETKVGESTSEPYAVIWTNPPTGRFELTVRAADGQGTSVVSPPITIAVTPAISVTVSSPPAGATFPLGEAIPLAASVVDPEGAITMIEFFSGTNRIGQATAAPYTFTWTNAAIRSYTLTATATDRNGVSAASPPVSISVLPPPAEGLITDGLVGHYEFEANALDSSPSENHATEIGGPTYAEGQIGQAMWVNGVDQRADAPTAPLLTGNTPQSVSVWFNQLEQVNKGILAYGADGDGHRFEVLLHSGVSSGHFWGDGFDTIAGGPPYTPGTWHHAVITYDGTTVRSYLDGQLGNEKQLQLDILEGPLHLGSGEPDGGYTVYAYFNGGIDDVGLWNRVLSPGEVAAIYQAGLEGNNLTQAASPPRVSLTSPADGETFEAGTPIIIEAEAAASGGSAIVRVEFYAGADKIGESTASPYRITVTDLPAGRHALTARVTDDRGGSNVSSTVNVAVIQIVPLTSGLVAHFKFDGNPNDSSTNELHGSEIGGPAYVAGKIGQALEVNGIDQRVDAPDPGLIGSTPQSVSLWFNQAEAANKGILAYGNDGEGHRFEVLVHSGVTAGHFWGAGFDTIAGGPPYTAGEWHHAVITYDGQIVRSYLNGQLGNQLAVALDIAEGPLHLGSGEPDGGFTLYAYFNGLVDDVGLWNRELRPEEVEAIYLAGLEGRDLASAEVVERPALSVALTGDSIVISWPESAEDFVLETTADLGVPNWTAETTAPVIEAGTRKVTLPQTGPARFYRLRK